MCGFCLTRLLNSNFPQFCTQQHVYLQHDTRRGCGCSNVQQPADGLLVSLLYLTQSTKVQLRHREGVYQTRPVQCLGHCCAGGYNVEIVIDDIARPTSVECGAGVTRLHLRADYCDKPSHSTLLHITIVLVPCQHCYMSNVALTKGFYEMLTTVLVRTHV